MRLCHLLVRQVPKNDNPENPENPGSDNSARTKHPMVVNLVEKVLCYYYNSTGNLYQINLIRSFLIAVSIARHGDLALQIAITIILVLYQINLI